MGENESRTGEHVRHVCFCLGQRVSFFAAPLRLAQARVQAFRVLYHLVEHYILILYIYLYILYIIYIFYILFYIFYILFIKFYILFIIMYILCIIFYILFIMFYIFYIIFMVFYINFAVKLRKLIMTPLTPIALWAGYW